MAGTYDFGGITQAEGATAVRNTLNQRALQKSREQRGMQRAMDLNYLNRDRSWGEAFADTAVGIGQGVVGLGEAAYGVGNLATLGLLEQGVGLAENFDRTRNIMEGAKTDQLQFDKIRADQTFEQDGVLAGLGEYLTTPSLLGDLTATNVPSILPAAAAATTAARAVGVGGAARGMSREAIREEATKRATRAASVTGGAQMGGAAYTAAYTQAINEGLTPEEANQRALAAGYATGAAGVALSRLPGVGAAGAEGAAAATVAGVPAAAGNVARNIASATGREASEEFLQSGAEQAILNAASIERELLDDVAKSASLGAVGGGLLGVGMGAVRAPSQLRESIEQSMESTAEELGDPDLARSNLQQAGDAALAREAEQLNRAKQALTQFGFQETENGTFTLPNDVLVGDQEFTLEQALEYASEDVVATTPEPTQEELLAELQRGVREPEDAPDLPLPEVGETGLLPEVEEAEVGYRAYTRVRSALEDVLGEAEVVEGRPVYQMTSIEDGVETIVDLDERSAIEAALVAGIIDQQQATEARRYVDTVTARRRPASPAPRNTQPLSAEDFMSAEEADQRVALEQSGYVPDEDGTVWTIRDGEAVKIGREEALTEVGYVSRTEDLLGDPASSPVRPAATGGSAQVIGGTFAADAQQLQLRGLDPLYDAVDTARRKEAGVTALRALMGNTNRLPAPEADPTAELRNSWMTTIDNAVEAYNGQTPYADSQIAYNQSMRNSGLIRGFVNEAIEQGIDPASPESFDFIQEKAREAETDPRKVAQVLSALADIAGAVAPGTADLPRWRKAVMRRKIAKPGQMNGPAYSKFKGAVANATITPGSVEFDKFMQNFSAGLTESEADTTFGKAVRSAYPYKAPEQAVVTAKKQQVRKPKAQPAPEVVAATKTAQEKVLTEPAAKLPPKATAKDKAVNAQKAKVQAALMETQAETEAQTEAMEERAARARVRPEDLVDDEPTGSVDPDLAAAEAELDRSAPRPLPDSVAEEVNAIIYESERRIKAMAARLSQDFLDLKAAYVTGNPSGEDNANAWQQAITAEMGERLSILDTALTKDVTNVTAWTALAGLVMQNPEFSKFADNPTKHDTFVSPMLARFANIVSAVNTPDGMRLYRTMLDESGIAQFIESELGGQFKKRAQNELNFVQRLMDEVIERKTADPANPANQKPFKKKRGKHSILPDESAPDTRISGGELRTLVERWNESAANVKLVEVYDTVAQAQDALGIAIPSAANGVYYNGKAVAIAENIVDQDMAYEVFMHERTHGGLEGLLGQDRLAAVTNRLWANGQIRRRVQAKMKSLRLSRTEAAEEVLVDMVVGGEALNKSVMSKIRSGIARFADVVLGVSDYTMTDVAVNELLRDTADYLTGAKNELSLGESYVDGLEAYMNVVDGRSVPVGPKFSVASAALDEFAAGGARSDVVKLQGAYREAQEEGLKNNLGGTAVNTAISAGHRVRRISMDFMPATQIANLNQGLFFDPQVGNSGTDLLQKFVEDKMAKENDFNKVIQQKQKIKYKGPDGEETFNVSMLDIARDWQAVTFKSGGQADALNIINQDGTFFKVHPDRDWSAQSQLDYSRENYTEAERRQAHLRVREQWNKLTPENKTIYRKAQAAYAHLWSQRMKELGNTTARIRDTSTSLPDPDNPDTMLSAGEWHRKTQRKIEVVMGRINEGPYSPLQRFGEYYVTIRNRANEVVFNSGHETLAEAEAVRKHMESQLEDGYNIRTDKRGDFVANLDGMSKRQYDRVQKAVAGMFPGDDPTDRNARVNALKAIEEVYLQSQPDSSLLTHANARKNIAGATTDSFRAFNDYVIKSARNLSSMRYDHQIQGALNDMKSFRQSGDSTALNVRRTEVLNAIQKQHLASQQFQNNAISEGVTQASFLMWMTSPSQLFLNMSQTALVTLPRLAARYGVGSMLKYIAEASSGFARSKTRGMHSEDGGLDQASPLYKVLQSLYQDGTLDFTLAHDVSDMAQRDSDLVHSRWREATRAMAVFIHKSEVYNREVAAYAVVRGEMKNAGVTEAQFAAFDPVRQNQLIAEWSQTAKRAVLETQFEYSQSNKAAATQGPVARVVFQFQQFRLNMLAMIAKDVRDSINVADPSLSEAERQQTQALARRTLAYMTTTQLLLTGATGSVLAPVVFGVMKMLQDDDEILSPEEQFLQASPQWLSMGLMSGMLDPQRFGFQSLLPIIGGSRYMPASDDPQDTLDHILLNSLGPAYGLGSQWINGVKSIAQGEYLRATTEILPKPFADALAANVRDLDGIKDRNGIAWYQPSPWDRVVNTLGLKSGTQAEASADRSAIYSGMQRASDRRSKLVGRWVTADGYEARTEAMSAIQDWNRKWGRDDGLSIKQSTMERAMRTRTEKQRIADETGVPNTRIPETIKELIRD